MIETPPAWPVEMRRNRRRVLGYASYTLGCLFIVATVFSGLAALEFGQDRLLGLGLFVGLLLLTVLVLVIAEGFLVPGAREVCAVDQRRPVVFLRPFEEDKEVVYDMISSGDTSVPLTAKAEDFLLALNAIGPLVSIAEPSLAARIGVHPHGVARDYIGAGDWQTRVIELLDQADIVVLAIGDSKGIEWEIEQVRSRVGPESLLLYLPPRPVDALTRKGREKKEQAIYAHFAPLVERHFGVRMPPFSAATYLIGFDADGQAVMAPDAPRRGWALSEHGRVAGAVRAQLEAVLSRIRPGADLSHYRLPGRGALWARLVGTVSVVLASVGIGLGGAIGSDEVGPLLSLLTLKLVPGLALVAAWALLARYFGHRWVWLIPLLIALGLLADMMLHLALSYRWADPFTLQRNLFYQLIQIMLDFTYPALVLLLGLRLLGRRATAPSVSCDE